MYRETNSVCSYCDRYLIDISGLGDRGQNLVCKDPVCPSHFKETKCPNCESLDKNIEIIGMGHKKFECKTCTHQWYNGAAF